MKIKNKFELIYGRSGEIYNILPIKSRVLNAFEISKEDLQYLRNLVKMHIRSKNEVGNEFIFKNLENCRLVRIKEYPLPSFVSADGISFVNLSVLPSDDSSDYSPTDMYALFLYALSLSTFITKQAIPDGIEEQVAEFIFAIFMKIFRKKSGLAGARELIPKLHFLISLYVHIGMFGYEDSERERRKIATSLYTSIEDLKLDYNFSSITSLLKAINDNSIISVSNNKFSTEIINRGDIASLPMFEDISRFFSSLLSSTIPGSRIFSNTWSKVRPDLFQTLVNKGQLFLNRAR